MDKWATLEPVKLHESSKPSTKSRLLTNRFSTKPLASRSAFVGPLPAEIHILILAFLPIPSLPSYARASRALYRLSQDERLWERKWNALGVAKHDLSSILDDLEGKNLLGSTSKGPPMLTVDDEDDFGDFASAPLAVRLSTPLPTEAGNFVNFSGLTNMTLNSAPTKPSFRSLYIRAHTALIPLCRALLSPPHLVLSSLFPPPSPPRLRRQSLILHLLALFLSPSIQPLKTWSSLRYALRAAMDRFDAALLSAFDTADGKGDEPGMKEAAWGSWEVWEGKEGEEWEMGKVWAEKREIFYEGSDWNPLNNFTKEGKLGFEPMDEFINHILDAIRTDGSRAVRVFPPTSGVLPAFSERLAVEVIGDYITRLLSHARGLEPEVFLMASAATFVQAWRMVDVTVDVGTSSDESNSQKTAPSVTRIQAEDIVFRMFEPNMDEYLDEEVENAKQAFGKICTNWGRKALNPSDVNTPQFLASHNPAQVKRTLLASFTNVLLLPVTIVPRTVTTIVTTGGNAAINGISMLNPQRWMGQASAIQGYRAPVENGGKKTDSILFESTGDDGEDRVATPPRMSFRSSVTSLDKSSRHSRPPTRTSTPSIPTFDTLQLLLSLDVALEIIHAARDSLKRAETFQSYPGAYGHKVRETIEELFILMLQVLNERHIGPGFEKATEQMRTYKPSEQDDKSNTSVAPLIQFFELVHIGDTIQSMIQVFFEKELAIHIDRTDFLNGVVREKKRFENALDESVAGGLNAGTEVLMQQVEHIIWTRTGPREYYPQEGEAMDLGPTLGCREAIACLEIHCNLLKGSTSKEVLEVFYQEVGIRLHAIIQKHLKRQIISLEGGFQVIADLNAYHAFIASLRVPQITADFANLKMLGHVYIVSDAKDLAQIVRDATRYGGSFRPEDVYEFIQRRSDWKKIEKTVDKTMYNLSFKDDCVVC